MADPRLAALDIAMPRIARRLQELQARMDRMEGVQDPEAAAKARVRGIYRGVFRDGTEAHPGDLFTFAGSLWHCDRATKERPTRRPACWTLAVKQGRASTLEED